MVGSALPHIWYSRLDFKPPGERILANVKEIIKNCEVVFFLIMMMFAGVFWGFIEGFLFWFLDDIGATKLEMGWTVTIGRDSSMECSLFISLFSGMVTSLPFLVFSGPITDMVGHINVIIIGMVAYFVRMVGYSFLEVTCPPVWSSANSSTVCRSLCTCIPMRLWRGSLWPS